MCIGTGDYVNSQVKEIDMWTGVYLPNDHYNKFQWTRGNCSQACNNAHWNEGPSYCVRLIVFEMPDD